MKTTCKFCWALTAAILFAVIAVGAWYFVRGTVTEGDDGRTSIILTAGERDFVLEEMRSLLEAVEAVTFELAEANMDGVAAAARAVGMGSAGGEPVTLIAKLPLEFKQLGMATHNAFDALAVEAEDMGDSTEVLRQLSAILTNCTSCHAGYRFDVAE
jgi:cytochrome c556